MKSALRLAIPVLVAIASLAPAGSAMAATPSVDWPTWGSVVNDMTLAYTLPEDATPGTVKLVFTGAASRTVVLKNSSMSAPTIKLNIANLAASCVASSVTGGRGLPDGAYSVTLQYQDKSNQPQSSAELNFTLDTVTLPSITFSLNSGQAVTSDAFTVNFTLPEAAYLGSVKLLFHPIDGGSGDRTVTLNRYGLTKGLVSINTAHPDWGFEVMNVAPSGAITPGEYDISLSYQDTIRNAPAHITASEVLLGRWTARTKIGMVRPSGGKLKIRRGKGAVALTLNGAGSIDLVAKSSRGKALGTCEATFASKGRRSCVVALNAAGRKALAKAGRGGVRVTLTAAGSARGRTAGTASLPVKLVG